MLKLIDGAKKQPRFTDVELARKYLHMAKEALDQMGITENITDRWALRKFAYCQARFLSLTSIEHKDKPCTIDDCKTMFNGISVFKEMLSLLTPTELLQTFPITKTYDGSKYQCKDYFSVMESLKVLDMGKPFREQNVDMLKILYDYQNRWIDNIVIYSMLLVDKIRVAEGKDDMFTAFCKSQGMKPPRTIKVYEDAKGKKYMVDENGKSMPLHKAKPKWLKVVK